MSTLIRVFIADDHAIVRDGLTHVLGAHPGMRVIGAASQGRDAVTQVRALQPDVVVMDIAMPGLNGIDATREILKHLPDTRVVVLSMYSSIEHLHHAFAAGVLGYVLKDSAGQEIVDAVRAVHAGREFRSARLESLVASGALRRGAHPLAQLSARERQVLQLVAEGHSSSEIARTVHLSPKSVDTYRSRIMAKLDIHDVAGLVKFAIQHGVIPLA